MYGGDVNHLGPTSKESDGERAEEMLEEADRLRRSHPERARRPGLWHRIRAKLTRRR